MRNDVSNTGANGIQINADLSTGGDGLISNWRIEGNTVRNCKGPAGLNLDGAIKGVARNNVIFNAAKGGITLFQGDGAQASHDNLIVNNTVFNPMGSRAAIQVADGADNNVVFNNILVAHAAAFEVQTAKGLMHDYNLVSSYTNTTASAHESAPLDAAALFVDATGGDLRLASLTPPVAVDRGDGQLRRHVGADHRPAGRAATSGRRLRHRRLRARVGAARHGRGRCGRQWRLRRDGGAVREGGRHWRRARAVARRVRARLALRAATPPASRARAVADADAGPPVRAR